MSVDAQRGGEREHRLWERALGVEPRQGVVGSDSGSQDLTGLWSPKRGLIKRGAADMQQGQSWPPALSSDSPTKLKHSLHPTKMISEREGLSTSTPAPSQPLLQALKTQHGDALGQGCVVTGCRLDLAGLRVHEHA